MSPVPRADLLNAAGAFCDAFATQRPPEEIFAYFTDTEDVTAIEHGLPELVPFLGREFKGQAGIRNYFQSISSSLKYENMHFSNYLVDTDSMQVSVRGTARFTWSSTGQAWDEVFTYVLAYDQQCKLRRYEVWADTGAAYLASKGQLI